MSAFIVSNDHIDALVSFALAHRTSYWTGSHRVAISHENAEEIGRILMDENVASVAHLYQDRIDQDERDAGAAYRFREFDVLPSPVVILKACDCYDYQACEHDGWDASMAKIIVNAIRRDAVRALPGYEAAPWGIDNRRAFA